MSITVSTLIERAYEQSRPITAQLELTYKCNLLCSFCYNAPKQRPEMDGEQWLVALDRLQAAGTFTITLTGGEPFVHRDFWRIAAGVRERGLVLKVYTNGVLLADRAKAERYAELAPFDTEISLHGARAATHDRLTGIHGSFDRLMEALANLSAIGVKVTLKTPITRLNQRELREVDDDRRTVRLQGDLRHQHHADRRRRPEPALAGGGQGVPDRFHRRPGAAGPARPQPAAGREDEAELRHRPDDGHDRPLRGRLPVHRLAPAGLQHPRSRGLRRRLAGEGGPRTRRWSSSGRWPTRSRGRRSPPTRRGGSPPSARPSPRRRPADPYAFYGAARVSGLVKLEAFRRLRGPRHETVEGERLATDGKPA